MAMIDVIQRQDVTILQLVHGKANALDVELCRGITEHLERLSTSSSGAVVLLGTGNIFSAGVDLLRVLDEGAEYLQTFLPALTTMFETVFFYPKPVVAAVNGHAIAGGCVLACAADHRVMARAAGRIGVTELLVGLPFPTIALEIMRFTSVPQHLQALIYDGMTFLPQEAINRGLVDEIVEPQDLVDRALAAAKKLLSIPALTFNLTKRQLRQSVRGRLQEARSDFDLAVQEIWTNPETREAIQSYVMRTFKKPKN
jgi:enoyl-CoA hydratase